MIELRHFSCRYPGRKILTDVDLDIPPGQITVVIGKNGSGKSTLAQILAGLKLDFQGKIWLDDLQLKRSLPIRTLRQKVGLVLQNPDHQILFDRVYDEIDFALRNLKLPEIENLPKNNRAAERILQAERQKIILSALEQVNLSDQIDANPQELSGGQKQRLAIASALALKPEYLVLDEATSMLDHPSRLAIYQLLPKLASQGIGIIMMTNLLEEILLADEVLILDDGKIARHQPTELIDNKHILTQHGLETPMLLRIAKKFGVHTLHDLQEQL